MSVLDIEKFILAVEKRPALYHTRMKEYANKNLKQKLWSEVCEEFIENWRELDDKEKNEKGKELKKKWKNLRTCFKREYDAQKFGTSGAGAKKKRKYLYFDMLLFLKDSVEHKETPSTLDQVDVELEDSDSEDTEKGPGIFTQMDNTAATPIPISKKKKSTASSYEESLLQILQQKKEEIDEDKYFLLSLLPAFKKFNEDQKFHVKTEILRIMWQVRLSGSKFYHVNDPNRAAQSPNPYQYRNADPPTAQLFSRFAPGRSYEQVVSPASSSNQDE